MTANATSETFWWDEHKNRIVKLEAQNRVLRSEVDRLSDMVDNLVGRVHGLESKE